MLVFSAFAPPCPRRVCTAVGCVIYLWVDLLKSHDIQDMVDVVSMRIATQEQSIVDIRFHHSCHKVQIHEMKGGLGDLIVI